MLKIPVEYDSDTLLAKLKGISCQLPALLPDVSVAIRELWWLNQEWLELKMGMLNIPENGHSAWDALYDTTL
jgi:hypothetical protein